MNQIFKQNKSFLVTYALGKVLTNRSLSVTKSLTFQREDTFAHFVTSHCPVQETLNNTSSTTLGMNLRIISAPAVSSQVQAKNGFTNISRIFTHKKQLFSCSKCDKQCNTKSELVKHKNTMHSEQRVVHCHTCEFTCSSKEKLKQHTKEHIVYIECIICNKQVKDDPYFLEKHKRNHLKIDHIYVIFVRKFL